MSELLVKVLDINPGFFNASNNSIGDFYAPDDGPLNCGFSIMLKSLFGGYGPILPKKARVRSIIFNPKYIVSKKIADRVFEPVQFQSLATYENHYQSYDFLDSYINIEIKGPSNIDENPLMMTTGVGINYVPLDKKLLTNCELILYYTIEE